MNKIILTTGVVLSLALTHTQTHAQTSAQNAKQAPATVIYKLVDDSGRVTYSNLPMKGAVKVDLDPLTTLTLPQASVAPRTTLASVSQTPALPNIDSATQKKRDGMRRKILEDEVRSEEQLLNEAKLALTEQESDRSIVMMMRAAAEKQSAGAIVEARRAYDQREEKLRAMQDAIATHEKNVGAIKKELAALK